MIGERQDQRLQIGSQKIYRNPMLIGVHQQPKTGLKYRVVYYIEESFKSVASVVSFWFIEKLH